MQDGAVVGTMQLTFLPGLSRQGQWRGQIEAVRIAVGRAEFLLVAIQDAKTLALKRS